MIRGRFGDPVEIVRLATLEDVQAIDYLRRPDARDRAAIRAGQLLVIRYLDNTGGEDLALIGYLRADGGLGEIQDAIGLLPPL